MADELFLCLLLVADGGVERYDQVVECVAGGVFAVVGADLVAQLVGDYGEAVDGFAVGTSLRSSSAGRDTYSQHSC